MPESGACRILEARQRERHRTPSGLEEGAHAIPRGPHPRTRANPANLTTRELEILPLLAAGLRNAEIATQLFLSPKTVDHHVSHILAKLGVHARGDVAPAARRLGLHLSAAKDRVSDTEK